MELIFVGNQRVYPSMTYLCKRPLTVSGWVLYRQLELTKLTSPDLHHVVGLFILRDVRPWHLFHYVPIIIKFSGFITIDRSDVHAKGQGQR